jgi:hypothetical protein
MKVSDFQTDISQFIYERDHSMIFARPGSGKTLPTLMAIQDWIETKTAHRTLIVAPIRVAHGVWRQEAMKWKIPLSFRIATGQESPTERGDALQADSDVLLTNYEMLPKILDEDHGCTAVVYDELSKLRAHNGVRHKLARNAARGKHKVFDIATGLTGSPAPNNYLSFYGMAHAVGLGFDLFGKNFDKWKRANFHPMDFQEYRWEPLDESALVAAIKPHTYIIDNTADLPPVRSVQIDITLPDAVRKSYDTLRKTSTLTDLDIVAGNAGVLHGKLRQIAAGFVYDNQGRPVQMDAFRVDALADLVDEMQGEPLLVLYEWREQLAMLLDRWPKTPVLGGGYGDADTVIAAWNARKLPLLFMQPGAAAHGNNMAAGGNTLAWLQPPYDNELYEQAIGRLRRRDQPNDSVISHLLMARYTLDYAALARLIEREQAQNRLWSNA